MTTMYKSMPQIDGLRALAVLAVLVSHFGLGDQLRWISELLPWGHLGVRLFFVISGFLITGILLDRKEVINLGFQTKSNALSLFYARRFLRIFPIFYLTIAIAYGFDVGHMREMAKYHLLYLSNFDSIRYENLNQLGEHARLRDPSSDHFWSLAVEEQFYLLWPALVFYCSNSQLKKIIIGMLITAPVWRFLWLLFVPETRSSSLFACTDTLAAGAMLALFIRRSKEELDWLWLSKNHRLVVFILGLLLFSICTVTHILDIFFRPRYVLIDTGESILFVFLVARYSRARNDAFGKLLLHPSLQYIGKISYGIYVYHMFMISLQLWLWKTLNLIDLSHSILKVIILISMTMTISMISWHFIELPIARLKNFIPRGPDLAPEVRIS